MIVRSGKTPWIGARDGLGSEPESTAEGALSAGSLGWQPSSAAGSSLSKRFNRSAWRCLELPEPNRTGF